MEGALSEHQVNIERQWTSYVTYKYGEGENILNSGHWYIWNFAQYDAR